MKTKFIALCRRLRFLRILEPVIATLAENGEVIVGRFDCYTGDHDTPYMVFDCRTAEYVECWHVRRISEKELIEHLKLIIPE